ncbi:hypothetical protein QR685DRAFT_114858 [Neurospora intermedia]|uniref:Uncharacterized protein n=1 Tax=Neurospora intermedia TaxID=5142 RepID=A0ABR3D016_NEUIN
MADIINKIHLKEHHSTSTPRRTAWSLGGCPAGRSACYQSDFCLFSTQPRAINASISRGRRPLFSSKSRPANRKRLNVPLSTLSTLALASCAITPPYATPWTLRQDSLCLLCSLLFFQQATITAHIFFTLDLQRPPLISVINGGQLRIRSLHESKQGAPTLGLGLCFQR